MEEQCADLTMELAAVRKKLSFQPPPAVASGRPQPRPVADDDEEEFAPSVSIDPVLNTVLTQFARLQKGA